MNTCFRLLMAVVVAALLLSAARAEVSYSKADDDDSVTVIRMTVTPAAEPVPALKERLVAREIDLQPGNAAPYYYRAMLDLDNKMGQVHEECGEAFDGWYSTGADATPLDELPLEKVRKASSRFNEAVEQQLATGTMRRDCQWEWGVEELRGSETIMFLLPDVQQLRNLVRLLSLRTRLAIAEGHYENALDAMRMNYRMASDTARTPLLISALVGVAQAGIANGTVIELIAAPDSPNLYWALSELPRPLVDMRDSVRFEMNLAFRMFPFLHNAETTDHSPEEWNRLLVRSLQEMNTALDGNAPIDDATGGGLAATGLALVGYPHAKEQLVAQGMDRGRVERMAVGQVIAIYTERNLQRLTDDVEKLWYVPYWEMRKRWPAVERELEAAHPFSGGPNREVLPVASMLLPAINAARSAEVRLARDVAALRVIEALRMYAAGHDGKLPASLSEITVVPVPANPATGQPFEYRLDGQTAVLELPASDGVRNYARRFEITIAQQQAK